MATSLSRAMELLDELARPTGPRRLPPEREARHRELRGPVDDPLGILRDVATRGGAAARVATVDPDDPLGVFEGGGSAPGLNAANTTAPSFTLASQTQGPIDAAIQGMNAASAKGAINNALGITSPAGRTLSNAIMSHAPVISGPLNMAQQLGNLLGAIRGIAAYMGVDDDSPTFDDVTATLNNMNSPISANAFQGLIGNSFDAGRLASQNAKAPFGRGDENAPPPAPPPAPDPTFDDVGPQGDTGPGPGVGTGGPAGGGTGAGGGTAAGNSGDSSDAEDRGGLIGRKPRRRIDAQGHVMVKALPSEFIVRPSETRKLLPALKDLNKPGTSKLERKVLEFEKKHGNASLDGAPKKRPAARGTKPPRRLDTEADLKAFEDEFGEAAI